MIPKSFDAIKKRDIDLLLENSVRERRSIEYKKKLPGSRDSDKREFLADVSSFANASGGDLLFGIESNDGIPTAIDGVECEIDNEISRLESIIRSGLNPRIPSVRITPITGYSKGPVILLRIQRSWVSPHMVVFKNSSRFFTRSSNGKYQMDVSEIRLSFLSSDALPQRIGRFRDDRLARIISGDTPVPIPGSSRLVIHLCPIASFNGDININISRLQRDRVRFPPIGSDSWNNKINLDGYVTYSGNTIDREHHSYCQVMRSGQIEAVWADLTSEDRGICYLPGRAYEEYTIEAIQSYVQAYSRLEIPLPVSIYISLLGVMGVYMGCRREVIRRSEPIDRDSIALPQILVEDSEDLSSESSIAQCLRPTFDTIWNACGYPHSFNFNKDGEWKPM
jgi:hypothetical protein